MLYVKAGEVDDDIGRRIRQPSPAPASIAPVYSKSFSLHFTLSSELNADFALRLRESFDATYVTNFCNNRCLVSMLNDKFAKMPPGGASKNAFFKLCIAIYNLLCN